MPSESTRRTAPLLCVLLLTSLAALPRARGETFESFETYTPAAGLDGAAGGTDWGGNWAAYSQATTQSKALSYNAGTLSVNGGSQAAQIIGPPLENALRRRFPAMTDAAVYVGLLLRLEGFDAGSDFLQLQVSDGATGNATASLSAGIRNATGMPFFARIGESGGSTNSTTHFAANNTDFLLVMKFSKAGGSSTYNRTDLYVDPTGPTEPVTAAVSQTTGDSGLATLSLFNVRTYNFSSNDYVFLDEVRIGTTFAAVVPEPATMGLLALGFGGMAFLRRRRG